jgi:methyl-accepting chemotaxis protein
MLKRLKLRSKILAAMSLALVPVLGLGAVSLHWASNLENATGRAYQTQAARAADLIDRFMFERYGDVQAFAINDALAEKTSWYQRDPRKNAVTQAMDQYMVLYGCYAGMIAVDLEGRVIAAPSVDAKGRPFDDRELWERNLKGTHWFQASVAERFTTIQPHSAPGNDKATGTVIVDAHFSEELKMQRTGADGFTVGFAAPIKRNGVTIGVWVNFLDPGALDDIAKAATAQSSGAEDIDTKLLILNATGKTIGYFENGERSPSFKQLEARLLGEDASIIKNVLAGEDGFGDVEDSSTKEPHLAGAAHLRGASGYPGMNWSVVFGAKRDQALAGVRSVQWSLAAAVLSCLVVIAGVVWALLKQIATPIRAMTEVAKQLGKGDVDQTIEYTAPDEVGDLAVALREVTSFVKDNADAAAALAAGDLSRSTSVRSDRDVLARSVGKAQRTLESVVGEVRRLIEATKSGRLSERSTLSCEGAFADVVGGLNDLMASCQAPIHEAQTVLAGVAERDLTVRMKGRYEGDWDDIKRSLNSALDNLEGALGQVLVAADQVSTAASEITVGNQSLAHTATEQASSLDQVTSRLQEISSTGRQTAGNAQQARSMAQAASESALRGGKSMLELSKAIEQIKTASDRTAQIVKTIDEIAFQTNLLALNAAVEAARAGDAGKGFAVVAEEVRSLAMRSAEAARSTSQMIEDAVKSAERGVVLNTGVAKSLDEISNHVTRVVEVMAEIAVAADQQAIGISGANGTVEEISRATQQNAATTEQSASAAEELSGQAESMRDLVAAFRVQQQSSGRIRPAPSAPARTPPRMPQRSAKIISIRPAATKNSRPPAKTSGSDLIPFDDDDSTFASF